VAGGVRARGSPSSGAGRVRLVGRAGAVTAIQRCGSALTTNVHFHTLVAAGVFAERPDGSQRFVVAPAPPGDVRWRACWPGCAAASSAWCGATAST
jgi:hypothetical protein